ncbi:hypothetical protein [Paenibacillus riograndensis]|uniref:hypothetical protein n=1 Tax=Paenibacillus riograndensis TaxID=483937 RepID=UPI000A90F1D4|nr:hypothetical protein [Paenibacillus riograndensis]
MTLGKEYPVLSIEVYNSQVSNFSSTIGDFVIYRLRGDDGIILPYPSKLFEVTSNKMPSRWIPYKENETIANIYKFHRAVKVLFAVGKR